MKILASETCLDQHKNELTKNQLLPTLNKKAKTKLKMEKAQTIKTQTIKAKTIKTKTIKVFGKWILAGEYSALKGHPALAFPLHSRFVEMEFIRKPKLGKTTVEAQEIPHETIPALAYSKARKNQGLILQDANKAQKLGDNKCFVQTAFSSVLDLSLQKIGKTRADLSCLIRLKSRLAFGQGLGGSAVLCVLVGRLFQQVKWLKAKDLFDFCHDLENHLHGQSSGLDIAVTLKGKPVLYQNGSGGVQSQVFKPLFQPLIFLSYAGPGKSTKKNIQKIQLFWKKHPEKAQALNQQMNKAVAQAWKSLTDKGLPFLKTQNQSALCLQTKTKNKLKDRDKQLLQLKEAFSLAENCFFKWGLIGADMKKHIAFLKKQGALAVKPTGSGSGGYVLSLWPNPPLESLSLWLTPAF